jgi:hypothetical protein
VASLAVTDQFRIVRIPSRLIRIIGVTLPALGGQVPLETHVVGVMVIEYFHIIFVIPDKLTALVEMIITGRVTGIFVLWNCRRMKVTKRNSILLGYLHLTPMAVFTGKWGGCYRHGRILLKADKRTDRAHQVGIVADNTVVGLREVGIMMPPIRIHVLPAMTATRRTVCADHLHAILIRYDMTRRTQPVLQDNLRVMMSGSQAVTMTISAV